MNSRCPATSNRRLDSVVLRIAALIALTMMGAGCGPSPSPPAAATGAARSAKFEIMEAHVADIQAAIKNGSLTATELVELYLARIKAYNGACVKEPEGRLGRIETVPRAGQINALSTLNLRPAAREKWGFDARKARSMTDTADSDPAMPDALEAAAALDKHFAETGDLVGPLHGVVIAIKDQYDTFDMRTTSGGDAFWADDRPPDDATFIKRLREAGAIILAKSNLAEYASGGARSAFGGTFCNPYDTERTPNASSAGSGSAVAANLVTCAIAEETSSSIRGPAFANNAVGIAPTQELVSRDGMIGAGLNTRVGPICRTVEDAARILTVIAGYDPKDELTAFGVGRLPAAPYESFARTGRLEGLRIGVLREYMDPEALGVAARNNTEVVEQGIDKLRALGAEIVDPGPGGELFGTCIASYAPALMNTEFVERYPKLMEGQDQIEAFLDLAFTPDQVPDDLSLRSFSNTRWDGERKYMFNRYLRERGDATIKTNSDLISKANFYNDDRFPDRKAARQQAEDETKLDSAARLKGRFTIQQLVLQCMQLQDLDAVTYPTSATPPAKLGAPGSGGARNARNDNAARSAAARDGARGEGVWSFLGQQGFPAITVPAGFTNEVYDRVADPEAPKNENGDPGTKLAGPTPARLPVGIDFLARPFGEPVLLKIAAAYEAATRHREPPPGFGPLDAPQLSSNVLE
jgi:Asp-tRNA(Asn)/Glu-tRNA(Gln) amidotransferase A subunit family amidase